MPQALRTCGANALRSSSDPIADPPPVGGHTGATSDPIIRFFARTLSASRARSSLLESMLTCGSKRKRSTPSNRVPSGVRAFAVRSSIVSRSIGGSPPGAPLPTSPGHMALCKCGLRCLMSTPQLHTPQLHKSTTPQLHNAQLTLNAQLQKTSKLPKIPTWPLEVGRSLGVEELWSWELTRSPPRGLRIAGP